MNNCFRCDKPVPEPDLKEAMARESDWREWLEDHPTFDDEERVLICMSCSDELKDINYE